MINILNWESNASILDLTKLSDSDKKVQSKKERKKKEYENKEKNIFLREHLIKCLESLPESLLITKNNVFVIKQGKYTVALNLKIKYAKKS